MLILFVSTLLISCIFKGVEDIFVGRAVPIAGYKFPIFLKNIDFGLIINFVDDQIFTEDNCTPGDLNISEMI